MATIPTYYNAFGQPLPPAPDYSYGGMSPDIAIVMARKEPLAKRDLDAEYFLAFGTSPKGEL